MKRPTKRRTAQGRLAWLDAYLIRQAPVELHQVHLIDVGFGLHPTTSLETLDALESWQASIIAVDTDASIVAAAKASLQTRGKRISFQVGDFRLSRSVPKNRKVGLIRCANVLRGYREDEVEPAWYAMASVLSEGGVLMDATCDAKGAVGSCLVLRKQGDRLVREALLFFSDFSRGFAPRMFRDVLPRIYRRRAKPGSPIARFLDDWQHKIDALPACDVRSAFEASVLAHPEMHFIAEGLAQWAPSEGVPTETS